MTIEVNQYKYKTQNSNLVHKFSRKIFKHINSYILCLFIFFSYF